MALPDRKAMWRPILLALVDGDDHPSTRIREAVATHFRLTPAERSVRAGNAPSDRFKSEHAFALVALLREGLIVRADERRFVYRITDEGRRRLRQGLLPADDSIFVGRTRNGSSVGVSAANAKDPVSGVAGDRAVAAVAPASVSSNGSDEPGLLASVERAPLASPYRVVDEWPGRSSRDPFPFDPEELDRKTLEHMELQNEIARRAEAAGYAVYSPGVGDPVDFDLAWTSAGGDAVVEVKTLSNTSGEAKQIRLGIGQLLDYQHRLGLAGVEAAAVLALDRRPTSEHWLALCERVGITLCWRDSLRQLFE
jgi:hypothetical protein